jgi:hypothetical protein
MKYKVVKSFAGLRYKGSEGEEIDIKDKDVEADLLNAKYIEPIKTVKREKAVKKEPQTPENGE